MQVLGLGLLKMDEQGVLTSHHQGYRIPQIFPCIERRVAAWDAEMERDLWGLLELYTGIEVPLLVSHPSRRTTVI